MQSTKSIMEMPRLLSYQFRNAHRFTTDPNTNNGTTHFYVGDVGGTKWEEMGKV
jgi:hypothetical protein